VISAIIPPLPSEISKNILSAIKKKKNQYWVITILSSHIVQPELTMSHTFVTVFINIMDIQLFIVC